MQRWRNAGSTCHSRRSAPCRNADGTPLRMKAVKSEPACRLSTSGRSAGSIGTEYASGFSPAEGLSISSSACGPGDRTSVVVGKQVSERVDIGGRGYLQKKK